MTTPTTAQVDGYIEDLFEVCRAVARERRTMRSAGDDRYAKVIAVDLNIYERLVYRIRDGSHVAFDPMLNNADPPLMRVMGEVVIAAVGSGILVLDVPDIAPVMAGVRQGSDSARVLEAATAAAAEAAKRTRPTATGKRSVDL